MRRRAVRPERQVKEPLPTLTKALIIVAVFLFLFCAVCFVFSWFGRPLQAELVLGFFGLCGAELGGTSLIQVFKQKGNREERPDE